MAEAIRKTSFNERDLRLFFSNPSKEKCPYCGMLYDDFRTGETYESVYASLWSESPDNRDWVNKGRHTVLGRWHEIKQNLWNYHIAMEKEGKADDSQDDEVLKVDEF